MEVLVLIVVIILAISAFAYFKFGKARVKAKTESQKPEGVDPIDGLVELNLIIRKAALGRELTLLTETIIDSLVYLIPLTSKDNSASGELSWTVMRIATEYLPNKCIHPYIKLSGEERSVSDAQSIFKENLTSLQTELDDVASMLKKKDATEFSAKAKFLQQKFNNI